MGTWVSKLTRRVGSAEGNDWGALGVGSADENLGGVLSGSAEENDWGVGVGSADIG